MASDTTERNYSAEFIAAAWASGDPEGYVLALHTDERLGYLAPSDEWMNLGEPLPERLQQAADRLYQTGRLPEIHGARIGRGVSGGTDGGTNA